MGSWDCYCALCSGPLGIGFLCYGTKKAKDLRKRRKRLEVQKRRLAGEDVYEDNVESNDDREMDDASIEAKSEQQDGDVEENDIEDGDDEDSDYETTYSSSPSSSSSSEDGESIDSTDSDLHSGSIDDVEVPPEPEKDDTFSQASDLFICEGWKPYHAMDKTEKLYNYEEKHSYDPQELKDEDVKWIDRCRCLGFNPDARDIVKAFISSRRRYGDYMFLKMGQAGGRTRTGLIANEGI